MPWDRPQSQSASGDRVPWWGRTSWLDGVCGGTDDAGTLPSDGHEVTAPRRESTSADECYRGRNNGGDCDKNTENDGDAAAGNTERSNPPSPRTHSGEIKTAPINQHTRYGEELKPSSVNSSTQLHPSKNSDNLFLTQRAVTTDTQCWQQERRSVSTPRVTPNRSANVSQPSPTAEVPQPSPMTPITEVSQPSPTTEVSSTTEVSQPSPTNEVRQPSPITEVSQPSPKIMIPQPPPTTYVSQPSPSPTNEVPQPSSTTEVSKPSLTTEVSQSSPTTEVLQPTPYIEVSQSSLTYNTVRTSPITLTSHSTDHHESDDALARARQFAHHWLRQTTSRRQRRRSEPSPRRHVSVDDDTWEILEPIEPGACETTTTRSGPCPYCLCGQVAWGGARVRLQKPAVLRQAMAALRPKRVKAGNSPPHRFKTAMGNKLAVFGEKMMVTGLKMAASGTGHSHSPDCRRLHETRTAPVSLKQAEEQNYTVDSWQGHVNPCAHAETTSSINVPGIIQRDATTPIEATRRRDAFEGGRASGNIATEQTSGTDEATCSRNQHITNQSLTLQPGQPSTDHMGTHGSIRSRHQSEARVDVESNTGVKRLASWSRQLQRSLPRLSRRSCSRLTLAEHVMQRVSSCSVLSPEPGLPLFESVSCDNLQAAAVEADSPAPGPTADSPPPPYSLVVGDAAQLGLQPVGRQPLRDLVHPERLSQWESGGGTDDWRAATAPEATGALWRLDRSGRHTVPAPTAHERDLWRLPTGQHRQPAVVEPTSGDLHLWQTSDDAAPVSKTSHSTNA